MIPKKLGQKAIQLVRGLQLFDYSLEINQKNNSIFIPLNKKPNPSILKIIEKDLPQSKILEFNFCIRKKQRVIPIDFLAEKLPKNLLSYVPKSIDFIGDIAIIEIPKELEENKKLIGEVILNSHKQTNTVLTKSGAVKGLFRIRDLEYLAGENKTTAIYKEYGHQYHVDVAKTYFSPRLSAEHNRVASQVKKGEKIIDLFAGVGPFAIPIASKNERIKVYAIDINPSAIDLLKKNILLNRVEKQVVTFLGDARDIVYETLSNKADRIIMNLPEKATEFLDVAYNALKPEGGIIHYYSFVYDKEPIKKIKISLSKLLKERKRKFQLVYIHKVRAIAPYAWQVVVDVKIF
jgi:tRNA (guanine37-N1)-methyltransferase